MHEDFSAGWSNAPGKPLPGGEFRLVRCPLKGRLEVVCIADNMVGRPIHFVGSRTRPCSGPGCPSCVANQRPRWTGWIGGIDLKDNQKVILEVTERVARQIREARSTYRTLRGVRILLERTTARANGKISCRFIAPAHGQGELPTCPDVRPILLRIWGVHSADQVQRLAPLEVQPAATGTDARDFLPIAGDGRVSQPNSF